MRLTSESLSKERHTITEIGTAAFDTCGLRTLVLPSGVRYIQRDAITMCEHLAAGGNGEPGKRLHHTMPQSEARDDPRQRDLHS